MAAVIGRGIERLAGGGAGLSSDEVYDPNSRNNRVGLQSPFALYFTVTIATNTVAILGGIASEFDLHRNSYYYFDRCDAWLFANAVFGVLHIGAAAYVVHKIRATHPASTGNDGVYSTGYRLHDPRDGKSGAHNRPDIEAANIYGDSVAGPPDSLKRIRHVLCESKVFAGYIFVYLAYVCWHFFLEMRACNLGMSFAMRCADIFIWAAPCSFAFSVATLMHRQGRL